MTDFLHLLITLQDGFNEISRMTRKNLEAAVVASKRPGMVVTLYVIRAMPCPHLSAFLSQDFSIITMHLPL